MDRFLKIFSFAGSRFIGQKRWSPAERPVSTGALPATSVCGKKECNTSYQSDRACRATLLYESSLVSSMHSIHTIVDLVGKLCSLSLVFVLQVSLPRVWKLSIVDWLSWIILASSTCDWQENVNFTGGLEVFNPYVYGDKQKKLLEGNWMKQEVDLLLGMHRRGASLRAWVLVALGNLYPSWIDWLGEANSEWESYLG